MASFAATTGGNPVLDTGNSVGVVVPQRASFDTPLPLACGQELPAYELAGGDENFGKMGVTIISRPELRNRLAHPNPGANGQPGTPMPAAGLPLLTYNGNLTFNMDGEEVHVYAIPRAHTDGDSIIQFVNADVIMTGDFYRSVQFPNIDRANGGSLRGLEDGLSRVIALSDPNTRIVPGHGAMVDRNAVMAHRDIVIAVHKKVADLIKQGKSQEEVIAAKPARSSPPGSRTWA